MTSWNVKDQKFGTLGQNIYFIKNGCGRQL